jgi:hypothetical protein
MLWLLFQSLAQNQLFLFFTGILQRFKLSAPGGPDTVSTDPHVGFIHRCPGPILRNSISAET